MSYVVVGAGISGLYAALLLARAGRQVRVLERGSRPADSDVFLTLAEMERQHIQRALARTGAHVAQAGAAVVVLVDRTPFAVSDASRAIQSMLLAAWADGVGSNWVGFGGLEEVKTLLGIPAKLDVLAILPFGYPAGTVGRGQKDRKALATVAHRERYGQPFA